MSDVQPHMKSTFLNNFLSPHVAIGNMSKLDNAVLNKDILSL